MICCALGNKCRASVDSYCHGTRLHHKHPSYNRRKGTPEGTYTGFPDILQVDDRQPEWSHLHTCSLHQNTTSLTPSARHHSFQLRVVSIEIPVNLSLSPADLCMASTQGHLHFSSLWKRNILCRLSDGLRVGKNDS